MQGWLEQISQALDNAPVPAMFFFRDDDAGWADKQLMQLLDCFAWYAIPIDLAVIPRALSTSKAPVSRRVADSRGLIGIHQHGYSHRNHQLQGRKCEFGAQRSYLQQWHDIKTGRDILVDAFPDQLDGIFTPPWNRCSQDTVEVLLDLEFTALSRDNTGKPLACRMLQELPINIDWFKKQQGLRLHYAALGELIAQTISSRGLLGIMLHHELMDHQERVNLSSLLELLGSHPMAKCVRMKDVLQAQ